MSEVIVPRRARRTPERTFALAQGRLTAGLQLGADGFMTDFGEQVFTDMHFADGSTRAALALTAGRCRS